MEPATDEKPEEVEEHADWGDSQETLVRGEAASSQKPEGEKLGEEGAGEAEEDRKITGPAASSQKPAEEEKPQEDDRPPEEDEKPEGEKPTRRVRGKSSPAGKELRAGKTKMNTTLLSFPSGAAHGVSGPSAARSGSARSRPPALRQGKRELQLSAGRGRLVGGGMIAPAQGKAPRPPPLSPNRLQDRKKDAPAQGKAPRSSSS